MRQSRKSVKSSVQLTLPNQFQRFDTTDGIELVIDTQTGESFATQSGYARMSGMSRPAIIARCNTCQNEGLKTAEIQTVKGLKTCQLIPENIITDWIIDDNPKLAKAMLKAGVRVYIHTLAGFKVSSTAIEVSKPQQPELTKLELAKLYIEAEEERQRLQAAIKVFQKEVETLESNRDDLSGLVEVFDLMKASNLKETVPSGFYTINSILALGKYPLTNEGERKSLGRSLAATYRFCSQKDTEKCWREAVNQKGEDIMSKQTCYPQSFLKIAYKCLDNFFQNRDGNSFIRH